MSAVLNWFRNAKFRRKFLAAFGVPLFFVIILAIFSIVTIRNVESAFADLAEGPNRRLVLASDAIAELANCRRCILAMGYMSSDPDYVDICYESYRASIKMIIGYLDEYYINLVNDISLHDYEKVDRENIIAGVKEIFNGPYQQNVEELYKAAKAKDYDRISELAEQGLPMGDSITATLWELRSIVQGHLTQITTETKEYTNNAVGFLIVSVVLLTMLSIIVSLLMSNILRVPIREMEKGMLEIAKGNLLYPIRSNYKDELGLLSNQIGDMVDTISMLNKAVVIVDNVDELIFVTDLEYNIIFINRKVEELYEVEQESCIGQKCHRVVYGSDRVCDFCPLTNLLPRKGEFPSVDWERNDKIKGDDVCFVGKTSIIRWVDGSLVQIYTCKDDTLRKMHEQQQKRHAEELRASALAAEEASRAKSVFLANMSHEIRTPMNAVMGMSELILRMRKDLPQEAFENALAIKGASQNLLSIINDILDLSKIESGKLEIVEAEYQFSSLIYDLISILRVRLIEKPVTLVADIDPGIPSFLIGDEIRIRQILLNLLINAVKYTNEGFISLTVGGEVCDDRVVFTIAVADSGIGIKEEYLENLFGEFVRIDEGENKQIEGTGLGLPISQKLCEAMGGGITVESEYEKGSTFTVTLPQRFTKYVPFASIDNPESKSVLLIEPRSLYADSLAATFKALGVYYEIAADASPLLDAPEKFTHVFMCAAESESVIRVLEELRCPPQAVILAELMEAPTHKNARVLDLPAYSLSVANLLNNISGGQFVMPATKESFIAPEASVLIVDDMTSNLLVAKGLMAPYEMNITTCTSGHEAVLLAADNRYDIIFMDHMMPKMDGIEATERIRNMEGDYYASVPIIALTANAISGAREMFKAKGMNDFLAKPIETAKLDAMLVKWIPESKRIVKMDEEEPEKQSADESEFFNELKKIPQLSVNKAVSLMGDSIETYENIFKISVRLLPNNVSRLNELLNTDIKGYETEVHGVKGVLNNIGAYELGRVAYELEKLSKRGDIQYCESLHPIFISKLTAFIDKALEITGKTEPDNKSVGEKRAFAEAFPKIAEAVEYYNATEALDILTLLLGNTYGEKIDEAAADLNRALEYFDFDEAEEALIRLRGALESDE